jgi:hypothetical protein
MSADTKHDGAGGGIESRGGDENMIGTGRWLSVGICRAILPWSSGILCWQSTSRFTLR